MTVMFVDLADSTRIARTFKPEDARHIILAYRRAAVACVRSLDGNKARAFGDGLLTSFGYPKAHENDPERAVRASLAIHDAIKDLSSEFGIDLKCRIAIVTDHVLVGDEAEQDEYESDEFYGEAPTLAARLQGEATPGQTLVCTNTRNLTSAVFESSALHVVLRGFEDQGTFYRVVHEIPDAAQLELSLKPQRAEMVGRRAQLMTLLERWEQARRGNGQVVSVTGEAGVGKTRLLAALRAHPALGRHATIIYQCVEVRSETPYFPFLVQITHFAGIVATDDGETQARKMRATYEEYLDEEQLGLMTGLIAADPGQTGNVPETSEIAFRESIVALFLFLIRAAAKDRPLLLQFEDIHWIDPSSRAILEEATAAIAEMPIMLVVSHRPAAKANFITGKHVSRIPLEPLSPDAVRRLVLNMDGGERLEGAVLDNIVANTNGLPLFVEQFALSVMHRPNVAPAEGNAPIPEKIYGILFERLDSAGVDKDVALAATAASRTFTPDLLAAASGRTLPDTVQSLERLCNIGLLIKSQGFADERFRFRHVLIQEAGYQSLSSDHRRALHERIARYLLDTRPGLVKRDPEFVARQFTEAGLAPEAVQFWITAAEGAIAQFANVEAVARARRGLALIKDLEQGDRDQPEMHLRYLLAIGSRAMNGYGAAVTTDAFERVLDLADKLQDQRIFLRAAQGLFTASTAHANFERAFHYGERVAQSLGGPVAAAVSQQMIGVALTWQGRFDEARDRLLAAIGLGVSDALTDRDRAAIDVVSQQATASLAIVEAIKGNAREAIDLAERSVREARETGSPMSIGNAMLMACNTYQILRHPSSLEHAQALQAFAREHRLPFYDHGALSFLAVAMYRDGEARRGYDILRRAWSGFKKTASRANQVFVCAELAEGCLLLERREEGLAAVAEGLELARQYGERNFEAELHRLDGELRLMASENSQDAIRSLERAVEIARSQGAKLFELRAATRLAELATSGRAPQHWAEHLPALAASTDPVNGDAESAQRVLSLLQRTGS